MPIACNLQLHYACNISVIHDFIYLAPGCNYADMEAHMACTSSASQLRYASQIAHTKHSNHRSCTDRGNHTDCTQDSYGQSQPTTIGTHCDGATGYGGNERRGKYIVIISYATTICTYYLKIQN